MPAADDAWERIRARLHELRLQAGNPTFTQIGKDTDLHVTTVGNVMRGYSMSTPGWDALRRVWMHLGGDLAELQALHPRTPPTHVKSEVFLACPMCRSVLELKLRQAGSAAAQVPAGPADVPGAPRSRQGVHPPKPAPERD